MTGTHIPNRLWSNGAETLFVTIDVGNAYLYAKEQGCLMKVGPLMADLFIIQIFRRIDNWQARKVSIRLCGVPQLIIGTTTRAVTTTRAASSQVIGLPKKPKNNFD